MTSLSELAGQSSVQSIRQIGDETSREKVLRHGLSVVVSRHALGAHLWRSRRTRYL
jgi:hypothetical protein